MHTKARTVEEYLSQQPPDRREALATVRKVVLEHLPAGYKEAMAWGMIAYQVPLDVYPDTYNGEPLMYAALASQKNHMAIYLMGVYLSEQSRKEFEAAYEATGKRMDIGKSCVRFKRLDDVPLDLIASAIASVSMDDFVEQTKTMQATRKRSRKASSP
ncbi:MAG: DUF1801 domain-containing protein [Chitinivibrionales bacterium]|nr:DUF1801 domain-containing protein [Chitinivibrionales bacterium]